MITHPSPSAAVPPLAVGQLAASIAHEVDQPLAAIALHAQAALRCIERARDGEPRPGADHDRDEARAALRAVLEASARASDILRSMRSLASRAQAARIDCDLAAALDEVLDQQRHELARLGVTPRVALERAARRAWASPVQLRQLLRNLVGNALDALAAVPACRRTLRIAARRDGAGMLVLTVQDSGAGMDAGQARRAFEPMYTTKPAGMGLGLAICRAIADAHGGRVWIEGRPGQGCVAGFALPVGGAANDSQRQDESEACRG